jgi:pilus assembly protein Flp/PilA
MQALRMILSKLWRDDEGATMVEYALMTSLIAIAAFSGAAYFGSATQQLYQNILVSIVAALP